MAPGAPPAAAVAAACGGSGRGAIGRGRVECRGGARGGRSACFLL